MNLLPEMPLPRVDAVVIGISTVFDAHNTVRRIRGEQQVLGTAVGRTAPEPGR